MKHALIINNLSIAIEKKEIVKNFSLEVPKGQVHAIMGPNGSGKTTLAATLMGHPFYEINSGEVRFKSILLNTLSPDKRAKLGIFLAFQYPLEIEGARFADFLRQSYNSLYSGTEKQLGIKAFRKLLSEKMELLCIDSSFIERSVNFGFSGGEKKRAEILQLAVLNPDLAILDEIDSGLDIDALKIVCDGLSKIKSINQNMSILLITHYNRILKYLEPDRVHLMDRGKLIASGDASLAYEVEEKGYRFNS